MSNGNNGKVLTVICKLARILTVSRKSHYPIETLLVVFEKFTRAYLFQIALEIIWLPRQPYEKLIFLTLSPG